MAIQRALISVSDKTGLEEFAKGLHEFGVELISTGGTAAFLKGLGLPVIEISDYTGEPELFEGRLKTLHPMVHGGLLHRRDNEEHVRQAKENGIKPIDLVCVNLYPFEETVARPGVTLEEAIEKIDIGGPSMLRSAAKNYASVTVVSDPADYARILDEMQTHKGDTTLKTRENLAVKVFMRTSNYDNAITNYLGHQSAESTKGSFCICAPLYQELRYGDNPHQEASLYGSFGDIFHQLQGKEYRHHPKHKSYRCIIRSQHQMVQNPRIKETAHIGHCRHRKRPEDNRRLYRPVSFCLKNNIVPHLPNCHIFLVHTNPPYRLYCCRSLLTVQRRTR